MVFRIVTVVGAGSSRPTAGGCSTREYGILGSAYSSDGSGGLKRTLGIAPGACTPFICTACVTSTFLGTGFWTPPVVLASTGFAMAPPGVLRVQRPGRPPWPARRARPHWLHHQDLVQSGPLPAPAAFHRRILRQIRPPAVHDSFLIFLIVDWHLQVNYVIYF